MAYPVVPTVGPVRRRHVAEAVEAEGGHREEAARGEHGEAAVLGLDLPPRLRRISWLGARGSRRQWTSPPA